MFLQVAADDAHYEVSAGGCGSVDAHVEDESESEDTVWTITDSGAHFTIEPTQDDLEEPPKACGSPKISMAVSSDKFSNVPAFQMLSTVGLTEIPNTVGCGIGIHFTTNTWQIRYPADKKCSTGRTFGDNVKGKGKVSCAAALIQCLLWAWKQHYEKNPSSTECLERIKMLEGALAVGLGNNL